MQSILVVSFGGMWKIFGTVSNSSKCTLLHNYWQQIQNLVMMIQQEGFLNCGDFVLLQNEAVSAEPLVPLQVAIFYS